MILGFKRWAAQIDDLAKGFDRQIMGRALSRGASVLRRAIRAEIRRLPISPKGRRALSRGLYVRRHRPRGDGRMVVSVRFRTREPTAAEKAEARKLGEKAKPFDPWYWHLIEYGTAERATRKGWARGAVQATPFVRPALERAEGEAFRTIQRALEEELDKRLAEFGW